MEATLPDGGEHIKEADSPLLQLYCPVNEEDFVFAKVTNRVKQFTKITRIQHFPDQNQLMVSWRTGIGRVRLDSAQLDQIAKIGSRPIEMLYRPNTGGLIGSCIEIGPDMYLVHSNQNSTKVFNPRRMKQAEFSGEWWTHEPAESIILSGLRCYWISSTIVTGAYRNSLVRCDLAAVRQSVEAGVQELKLEIVHSSTVKNAGYHLLGTSVLILERDGEVTERSLETPFPVLRKCRLPTFEAQVLYNRLVKVAFGYLCLAFPQGSGWHNHVTLLSLHLDFPLAVSSTYLLSEMQYQYCIGLKVLEHQGRTYCFIMQTNGTLIILNCTLKNISVVCRHTIDQKKQEREWLYVPRTLEILPNEVTDEGYRGSVHNLPKYTVLAPGLAGQVFCFYLD